MKKIFIVKPRQSGKTSACINYTELYPNSVVISCSNDLSHNKFISVKDFLSNNYKTYSIDTIIIDDYLFFSYNDRLIIHNLIENNDEIENLIIVSSLNGPICNFSDFSLIRSLKKQINNRTFENIINDLSCHNSYMANNLLNVYHNYMTDSDTIITFSNINSLISVERLAEIKNNISEKEFNNCYLNQFDE